MDALAVGVPMWPDVGPGWDWWPVLGTACALAIARRMLGLGLTATVTAGCVVAGALFAILVHAWGVTAALLLLTGIAFAASRLRRTGRRGDPPLISV